MGGGGGKRLTPPPFLPPRGGGFLLYCVIADVISAQYRFSIKKDLNVNPVIISTTILAVRKDGHVAIGGDGQVTMNAAIVKQDAKKIRRLYHDKVIVGFAGLIGRRICPHGEVRCQTRTIPGKCPAQRP